MLPFLYLFAVSDTVLLHIWFTLCRACGNLTACVAERYLILRTGYEKHGRKNPLPYPISERSHVGNLRQIRKQGKGRSSKRKGNRRCPFLFALRRGCGESPRSTERSSPLRFSEKLSARQGRTRLWQFACPGQPVQQKEPPVRGEPACGSSRTPAFRCRKGAALLGRTRLRQFVCPGFPVQKRSRPVRANTLAQFVCPAQPVQKTSLVFKLNCFSDNATAKRHTQAETA